MPPPLVAIVGPTGIGKTRLAMRLAVALNGEIINADSRQVYCHMDIGTAKPTPEDREQVRHHLVDVVDPDQDFSLADYKKLALEAIADVLRRGKLPLLVGGSGLYIWTLVEGWDIPAVPPDPELRRTLEAQAASAGPQALYDELVSADPAAAMTIDPRNVRRVMRALEVTQRTGVPFSSGRRKQAPDLETFIVGLTARRSLLYQLVDRRVDDMLARGLVSEVENLLKIGYDIKLSALSGLGYRDIARFLAGELTLEEAAQRIKIHNHRYIRHQYAWFRLQDERIRWFDITTSGWEDIRKAVAERFSLAPENE